MKLQKIGKTIICFVFIGALLFAFYWLFGDDIRKKQELNELLNAELQKNAQLQSEIDAIREELAKMQDVAYLELLAREQGLAYPNETVYIYTEETDDSKK